MSKVNRWPAGTPWQRTGPGPGRFAPADTHAEEYATTESREWARTMRPRLRRMSGGQVRALFRSLVADMDEEPSGAAYHKAETVRQELWRRDREETRARERAERVGAAVDALVAKGVPFNTAWHQVTGQDPEALQAKDETLLQLRDQWELIVELEFIAAQRATNNQMVRADTRARVDPRDFWARSSAYVNAHASDEFKEWMSRNKGITTWEVWLAQKGRKGTIKDARDKRRGSMGEWG